MMLQRLVFRAILLGSITFAFSGLRAEPPSSPAAMVVVTGAGGTGEYTAQFDDWAKQWLQAANTAGVQTTAIGGDNTGTSAREKLQQALRAQTPTGHEPLWLVLIGHGTWDGKNAKFNLQGDDISVSDLAEWLKPVERPVIVIAAFSSSGAWLEPLKAPGRVILTATRSGTEENFSRLGQYLPSSFTDLTADVDKDGQVSLLEAWLASAKRTADFYTGEGRLATEHSLLEDNDDGRGTPSDWFQGVRAVKKSKDNALPDGLRAHQIHLLPNPADKALAAPLRAKRDELELELAKLREAKSTMDENAYYTRLEAILLQLAKLYAD